LAAPSAIGDAVTKGYIDSLLDTITTSVSSYIRKDDVCVMSGNLDMGRQGVNNAKYPSAGSDAATKVYVYKTAAGARINELRKTVVKTDGSSVMMGNFNTRGYKVTNLALPSSDNDAATKNYVDSNDAPLVKYDVLLF
jgi:hypothetical protein